MTKKKKIILSLGGVLLALGLYGWFFGIQTFNLIALRLFVDREAMDTVPEPLLMKKISPSAACLEMPGYSFSVPWTNCVESSLSAGALMWNCADTNIYVFCYDRAVMNQACVEERDRNSDVRLEDLNSALSYKFVSNMYFMTSSDVSFFSSREDAKNEACQILCKMIGNTDVFSGMYVFQYKGVKGFQQGMLPEDRMVSLLIYDSQGGAWDLIVAASADSSVVLTQEDINTIITTFKVDP